MQNEKRADVLIVGAGPSGLVLAIELARRHVAVRIVEAREGAFLASRAKGVQPRTLEIFHDLGVVDEILTAGAAFPRWRSYERDRLLWEKSIYDLLGRQPVATDDRRYAETWMIPQWSTEAILRRHLQRLGVAVEFGTRFESLSQTQTDVRVGLCRGEQVEESAFPYVVGADGARSTMRTAAGIGFVGDHTDEPRYIIADVRAPAVDRAVWHNWSIGGDSMRRVSLCPLPHSDYFQFVAPLPPDAEQPDLSLRTIQSLFHERAGRAPDELTDARWMTFHRPNPRLASQFRDGRVFLVGDAAHSPPTSAGQGMNHSIQDACNLGWKLAAVVAGASPALLASYEEERRPIAAGLLGVLTNEQPHDRGPSLQDVVRRDVFNLDLHYRHRTLSWERRSNPGAVRAGDRAPDGRVDDPAVHAVRLHDFFRGTHVSVLGFNGVPALLDGSPGHHLPIELRVLALGDGRATERLREIYDVRSAVRTLFVVRPDGMIGLVTDHDFDAHVSAWLGAWIALGQR